MEPSYYTDTILLEANRKSSAEYLAGNFESNSTWINDLGAGIKLDIGDTISVHSAYISEIGNESATIEVKGRNARNNIGERQLYTSVNVSGVKTQGGKSSGRDNIEAFKTSDGNYSWDYTVDDNVVNQIKDNEINLTHSYYKCAQGDNYLTLPRKWGADDTRGWWDNQNWSKYSSSTTGQVDSVNPYRLGTDYSEIVKYGNASGYGFTDTNISKSTNTTISHDGKRFTLFVRRSFKNYVPNGENTGFTLQGERDPAMMDFIWYKKTVKYSVSTGFNSPANVATQITNRMNDVNEIENVSYGAEEGTLNDGQIKQNNINLEAQSNTYEIFPCATAWFVRNAGELWFNDDWVELKELPLTETDTLQVLERQNCFSADSFTIDSSLIFDNGYCRTGWKFYDVKNATTGVSYNEFDEWKGESVLNMRAYNASDVSPSKHTLIAFKKESSASFTISNPLLHTLNMRFAVDHIPILFESCYSTVGYLRPEIQEAGRELTSTYYTLNNITTDGNFNVDQMTYPMENQSGSKKSTILTKIPWTEENLQKLKKLFDSQSLYPELFDWDGMSASQRDLINVTEETKGNISLNTMRFLHMNDSSQEETTEREVDVLPPGGSITDRGFFIPTTTTHLKRGMRVVSTDLDDDEEYRYFPENTFIILVEPSGVYVSNASNIDAEAPSNPSTIKFTSGGLGSDRYTNASNIANYLHTAGAVFFDYNPARKDISTGEGIGVSVYDTLTYGFAKKYTELDIDYIGLSVEKYQEGTLPQVWFNDDATPTIKRTRCIGFDKHFNAYGTGAILLTNGHSGLWGGEYNASSINGNRWTRVQDKWSGSDTMITVAETGSVFRAFQPQPSADGWFIGNGTKFGPCPDDPVNARLYNEIYCGANQPSLQFSGDSSRFSFTNLHTPELIGTDALSVLSGSDVGDANVPCYKLNKRLSRLNYSPDFAPYNNVFKAGDQANAEGAVVEKDNAITPYAIMDAQGGIFLEDYGCDESNWSQSLWELLGFTYSQLHNKGSRLQRFNDRNITTSTPTTNAVIKTEDLQNIVKGGSSQLSIFNSLEVNYPHWRFTPDSYKVTSGYNASVTERNLAFPGNLTYPPVSQQATSTSITAENLPRKMLSPIYLIKSDLLNPTYIGGRDATNLPVIGIVDKSEGYGDYFSGAKDSTIFTNTIPRTIQNITTSIVDAGGSEARVDDGCVVIYKITKQIESNANLIQNLINPPKK